MLLCCKNRSRGSVWKSHWL